MQSQEGGIVEEEYRVEYVVDRVNTLGRAVPRPDRRVRALPRPQVRPDHAARVLSALRLLQQRQRGRPDPVLGRAEPDGHRHHARGRRQAGRAGGADRDARSRARSRRERATTPASRTGSRPRPMPRAPPWHSRRGLIAHFPFEAPRPVIEPPKVDPKKPAPAATASRSSRSWCSPTSWTPRSAAASATSTARRRPCPARSATRSSWSATATIEAGKTIAFFERNEPFSIAFWFRVDRAGTSGPLFARSGARDERQPRLRHRPARRRHADGGPAPRRSRQRRADRHDRARASSQARGST